MFALMTDGAFHLQHRLMWHSCHLTMTFFKAQTAACYGKKSTITACRHCHTWMECNCQNVCCEKAEQDGNGRKPPTPRLCCVWVGQQIPLQNFCQTKLNSECRFVLDNKKAHPTINQSVCCLFTDSFRTGTDCLQSHPASFSQPVISASDWGHWSGHKQPESHLCHLCTDAYIKEVGGVKQVEFFCLCSKVLVANPS